MFTGIVDSVGRIDSVSLNNGAELRIQARYRGVKKGESIAVNGACLTVERVVKGGFTVHAVATTLGRTLIGEWRKGRAVNLERAVRAGDRLGGHFVQGHVDGVGVVRSVVPEGEGRRIAFELPDWLARFVAEKGSLAVDGASLTVASAKGARFEVAFVPHTLRVTLAGGYTPGRGVNLEVDLVARHIARLFDEAAVTRRPE